MVSPILREREASEGEVGNKTRDMVVLGATNGSLY